jgi:hypothetical protein
MTWLIVFLVLAGPVVAWRIRGRADQSVWDESTYRAAVGLHAVRRRLDVAHIRAELRRDASALRRELRDELSKTDDRGWL